MPFWMYGRDEKSGESLDPYFSKALDRENALAEAKDLGMHVESVEAVGPRRRPEERPRQLARGWVIFFRVLAVLVAALSLILGIMNSMASIGTDPWTGAPRYSILPFFTAVLGGGICAAFLLGTAEIYRLLCVIEGQTRGRHKLGRSPRPGTKRLEDKIQALDRPAKDSLTHEECRALGVVSLWLGPIADEQALQNYLSAPRSTESETTAFPGLGLDRQVPVGSSFVSDHGFLIDPYDDPEYDISAEPKPVAELLTGFTQFETFAQAAEKAVKRLGWEKANCVVVFYDFRYKAEFTNLSPDLPLVFIGSFRYGR